MNRWFLTAVILFSISSVTFGLTGNGSQNDPFLIQTLSDFDEFSDENNAGTLWTDGVYIRLDAEIDLAERTYLQAVIAPDTPDTEWQFRGVFDGNNHRIANLTIDTLSDSDEDNDDAGYLGLFGRIEGENAEVENLILDTAVIKGGEYSGNVGGICGYNGSGTISNCTVTASIDGRNSGGVCGYNSYGTISNCSVTATIYSRMITGSVCGTNNYGDIYDCHAAGSVSCKYNAYYVSGLCGYNSGGTIRRCSTSTTVSGGQNYTGGLCGFNYNDGLIRDCFAAGDISGYDNVGGLCGNNAMGSIADSYCTGDINPLDYSWNIGGFCGSNSGFISNCYSIGLVVPGIESRYYGSFCGSTRNGVIINCYWNCDTSGLADSAGGYLATTSQMKSESTYDGWNNGRWTIEEGSDYPHLAWENATGTIIDYIVPRTYNGDGISSPFELADSTDIVCMSKRMDDWDKDFILVANIDMSGVLGYRSIASFSGTLDGQGWTISNLSMDASVTGNYQCLGLFGTMQKDSSVSNLTLDNFSIACDKFGCNIGGLCGFNSGTISGCKVSGVLSSGYFSMNAGGLCGYNAAGTISDCDSTATFSAMGISRYFGGLCGMNSSVIERCSVQVDLPYGAGLTGFGGLCGVNYSTLRESCSRGEIHADYAANSIGGLCGENYGINSTISDCYSLVSMQNLSSTGVTGGLCGWNENGAKITRCFSAGVITNGGLASSFCGENKNANITASFWDKDKSETVWGVVAEGKTTEEMHTLSTYTDVEWDFVNDDGDPAIWQMPPCRGYPYLIWETVIPPCVTVPDLYNMPQGDAEAAIVASGFVTGKVTVSDSVYVPAGNVISQSPAAGISLTAGSTINLVISAGSQFVLVPDLTGLTQAEAADSLASLGLTPGIIITEYHPTAPVDKIFSQNPTPDTILLPGSPVDYIISLGWIVLPGQGTKDDPYLISSNPQLQVFSDARSSAQYWAKGVYTSLSTDLDLSGFSIEMIGDPNAFNGVFDGQNHVITNLRDTDHGLCNIGPDGVVMNIRLENIKIVSSGGLVGGIAASNQGLISNCCVSGSVSGGSETGGICGSNFGGTIEECYWTGDVEGGSCIGGIAGYNRWAEIRPGQWSAGTVRNCAAMGRVSGGYYVGGLVGCNYTDIMMCYSQSDVLGDCGVGGLIGRLVAGNWYGKVFDCFATAGEVKGEDRGFIKGNDKVGGLIGEIVYDFQYGSTRPVMRSYSTGLVEGVTDVGGLIGYNEYGQIDDCFWDVETSLQTTSANGGGISKTTRQMNDLDTFTDAGWDFRKPVWMFSTAPYPRLIWRFPDIDKSGIVDLADYAEIVKSWMQIDCGICSDSDLTGDLIVDGYDLDILVNNWLDGVRIGDHISAIELYTGRHYGFPDDDSDTVYTFEVQVYTGSSVEKIEFLTPAGNVFEIPKEQYVETILPDVGLIETQWEYDEDRSIDTGQETYVWFYEAYFNSADSLDNYGDGGYTFTVYFGNGRTDQTEVFFGDSATGQPLPQPTQEPNPLYPAHGGTVTSPVTLSWDTCADPNVAVIHLYIENEALDIEIETDGLLEKAQTTWGPFDLSEGLWNAGIAFAVFDMADNDDGITVTGIKYSTTEYEFTVLP